MTPEEQRAHYRSTCSHKRVGATVVALSDNTNHSFRSVNAAKQYVRSNKLRSYTDR
jgi:hypothetical protein